MDSGWLKTLLPCFAAPSAREPRSVCVRSAGATVTPEAVNKVKGGRPNRISTVRFTPLTWLPKSLFLQFKRVANLYFLFVSVLVFFPWSPFAWNVVALPFALVLTLSALKDLYEDLRRRYDDDAENSRGCRRYDFHTGGWEETRWSDVRCGDVLVVLNDELFAADLLLLHACAGQAFVSTANLDGETSLKERFPPEVAAAFSKELPSGLTSRTATKQEESVSLEDSGAVLLAFAREVFEVKVDAPMIGLGDVGGSFCFGDPGRPTRMSHCPLNFEHLLPRGCILRNTAWVLGVAMYLGEDTKTRLNVAEVAGKFSNMQKALNLCIRGIVVFEFCFCLLAAIVSSVTKDDSKGPVIMFCTYWIMIYHVVPISLYVCFEILKLLIGYQINADAQMVHNGVGAVARTADLVEELGQVDFIFSDKTGTLTENKMLFARCCVGGADLGEFRSHAIPQDAFVSLDADMAPVAPGVSKARNIMAAASTKSASYVVGECEATMAQEAQRVQWFFTCLVICSTVQAEFPPTAAGVLDTSDPEFFGSSPDEVALVAAADRVGVRLIGRTRSESGWLITVSVPPNGHAEVYRVQQELEFTSERKRMSVVCLREDGELVCVTKGADSFVAPLCTAQGLTEADGRCLQDYAVQGFRTLLVGSRSVDRAFFEKWQAELVKARCGSVQGRDERVAQVALRMETSLKVVGITAVEDRLQGGVPDAIQSLKAAGIRVWVLTGDKVETAVEVVRSCGLFVDGMTIVFVKSVTSREQAREMLEDARLRIAGDENGGMVLDGSAVEFILQSEEMQGVLYDLAIQTRACVCCRLSPRQKRNLVELVRARNPRAITLAIGDGANDVSMIQGAQVGIGIRGKEGSQAVQACDIAISQFRFLVPLLFCHGRRAYRRVAVFLCYYVYKHVVLVLGDLVWAFQSNFSGKVAYPEWLSSGYTVFFTSLPVICVVAFDYDVSDEASNEHPELYLEGPMRTQFNSLVFLGWMCTGVLHGSVAWLAPNLIFGGDDASARSFWVGSAAGFSIVILVVSLKLLIVAMSRTNAATVLSILSALAAYVLALLLFGYTPIGDAMQPELVDVPTDMVSDAEVLLTMLFAPVVAIAIDGAYLLARRVLNPTALELLRAQQRTTESARVVHPEPVTAKAKTGS